MAYLVATLTKAAAEWFISGAISAISLYTGVKTPGNRRKK